MTAFLLSCVAIGMAMMTSCSSTPTVQNFFITTDNKIAKLYTLDNGNGLSVDISDFGGRIVAIRTRDSKNRMTDVVLGYANPADYEDRRLQPCCKRRHCPIHQCGGVNAVHPEGLRPCCESCHCTGAPKCSRQCHRKQPSPKQCCKMKEKMCSRCRMCPMGRNLSQHFWKAVMADATTLRLTYTSLEKECGIPGNLYIEVTYHVTKKNELELYYRATTDAETTIHLGNRILFNLNGALATDMLDHRVWSSAYAYTETSGEGINRRPTGKIIPVDDTIYDLRQWRTFEDILTNEQLTPRFGFDCNFCISQEPDVMQRKVFQVVSKRTGISMEIDTDLPGVQFYMGQRERIADGKGEITYRRYNGFALTPQSWPNSEAHLNFPSARLIPGQVYKRRTLYRFGIEK